MSRQNELVSAEDIRAVMTDTELPVAARVIWTYIRVAEEPQNNGSLSADLGLGSTTVSRYVGVLRERGLIRRLNGIWMPQSPSPQEES
ncbi:hypothetical protein [Streptomyces similanensis]|uniref:Uncharacterized protein n=1 Tax=Streptomyces similanensis TaxID=1274988 RepID=A0ABP9LM63_9ACTN